jgi:hypothetical protein
MHTHFSLSQHVMGIVVVRLGVSSLLYLFFFETAKKLIYIYIYIYKEEKSTEEKCTSRTLPTTEGKVPKST